MNLPLTRSRSALAILALSALTLAACDQHEDKQTLGQQVDQTVAQAQASAQQAKDKVEAVGKATKDAAQDAAIVAAIHAKLAQDKDLHAREITVDAHSGEVTLSGQAPSAEARERATQLAQGTDGVTKVHNDLQTPS